MIKQQIIIVKNQLFLQRQNIRFTYLNTDFQDTPQQPEYCITNRTSAMFNNRLSLKGNLSL